MPRLRYKLIDERSYSTEDLQGRNSLSAVLFQLEKREEGWPELWKAVGRLMALLSSFQDDSLTATFRTWLEREFLQEEGAEEIPETADLEEFHTMLHQRIAEMNRRLKEEGRLEGEEKGIRKGRREGRREGRKKGELDLLMRQMERKFGPLEATLLARLRSADSDRLLEWGERLVTATHLSDVFDDD